MAMSEAIKIVKKSDLFKEWDGTTKPNANLIQLVYDWLYPDETAPHATKTVKQEIIEFLNIIKGE